jgi:hypothetical protein
MLLIRMPHIAMCLMAHVRSRGCEKRAEARSEAQEDVSLESEHRRIDGGFAADQFFRSPSSLFIKLLLQDSVKTRHFAPIRAVQILQRIFLATMQLLCSSNPKTYVCTLQHKSISREHDCREHHSLP